MRYFNEQWNQLSMAAQLVTFCEWHVTDRAEVYSEEFFEEAYLLMGEEMGDISGDPKEEKEFIEQLFQSNLGYFEQGLPQTIKALVADMRVLALGRVTRKVMNEIEAYSQQAKRAIEALEAEYDKHYQNAKKNLSKEAFNSIHRCFHDSRVIDCGYERENLFFKLRMDGGWDRFEDKYLKLIFKDASVLEGEVDNILCWWIDQEVYYEQGLIEFHIRFAEGDIIIQAADICCEHYHTFFASDTALHEQSNDEVAYGTMKELVEAGKVEKDALVFYPLQKGIEEEAYENKQILVAKDLDSFEKLAVIKSQQPEEFRRLTGKKYIYEIQFGNDWTYNPNNKEKYWERGEELLQYIYKYCGQQLELWSVWSDCMDDIVTEKYILDKLEEDDLEAVYAEEVGGIAQSRRIVITK